VQESFEWNVFLAPWSVIGPFPQADDGQRGLGVDYLGGETVAVPQGEVIYMGQSYKWQNCPQQVLDLDKFFEPEKNNDMIVAYAYRKFTSDKEQDAILSVGSDDGFRAWLNGEKVLEWVFPSGMYPDVYKGKVHLRKGENVLLLKVEDSADGWSACARFLPASIDEPLMTFIWDQGPRLTHQEVGVVPDATLNYLDKSGKVFEVHHVSGERRRGPFDIAYVFYGPVPETVPDRVQVVFADRKAEGLATKEFSWAKVCGKDTRIHPSIGLTVSVADAADGSPVPEATFVSRRKNYQVEKDPVSAADGTFRLEYLPEGQSELIVSATGYTTLVQKIVLPMQSSEAARSAGEGSSETTNPTGYGGRGFKREILAS